MGHRKITAYKIGVGITTVSIIVMAVCLLLMYLGNNLAILWFFIAAVGLVVGVLTTRIVKTRFEQGYYDGLYMTTAEATVDRIVSLKNRLLKRGVLGAVLVLFSILISIYTAIVGFNTLGTLYERSASYNAGYKYNLREAERYEALAKQYTDEGKTTLADNYLMNAEKCKKESEAYYKTYLKVDAKFDAEWKYAVGVASICVVSWAGYVAFCFIKKSKKSKQE